MTQLWFAIARALAGAGQAEGSFPNHAMALRAPSFTPRQAILLEKLLKEEFWLTDSELLSVSQIVFY
ncbi:MAG: hypothetical protein AAFO87_01995 [Cyanobacteria bacterium J06607_6]